MANATNAADPRRNLVIPAPLFLAGMIAGHKHVVTPENGAL
jgi:hypothetical protein